jgi:hypothetical protein
MSPKISFSSITLVCLLFAFGCSTETIEPQFTGNLKGQVINSKTGNGISNVSISTNPGTNAIVTDSSGNFSFDQIPTGQYTITAEKDNFKTKTVHVKVEKNKTSPPTIIQLESKDTSPASTYIKASVTNFWNNSRNDSSFVDIEYQVENVSDHEDVSSYQVYFEITTSKTKNPIEAQIDGDSLDSGQKNIGTVTKYLHNAKAKKVVVSSVWAPVDS